MQRSYLEQDGLLRMLHYYAKIEELHRHHNLLNSCFSTFHQSFVDSQHIRGMVVANDELAEISFH